MSFKQNHTINHGNYEEYFILYMDNELNGEQKLMVENFIAQHPHLAEELDTLISLKLPVDEVSFSGKEELLSANMKVNLVDDSLLLYIDNELTVAERKAVEQKIDSDKDYALQHTSLMQTKLDASEKIVHPNKKELYRHTERVVAFKVWMRVAAAVILLLLSSLFFLTNRNEKLPVDNGVVIKPVINNTPIIKQEKESTPVEQLLKQQGPVPQDAPLVKAPSAKKAINPIIKSIVSDNKNKKQDVNNNNNDLTKQREIIRFDVNRFTTEPEIKDVVVVNNNITHNSVTSVRPVRKTDEDTQEPAVTDGYFKNKKKTPAKGFFRKVSRFIERNTGIGTVNADNELLIGVVALKLK